MREGFRKKTLRGLGIVMFLGGAWLSSPVCGADQPKLSWAPPEQSRPTRIELVYDPASPAEVMVLRDDMPYGDPERRQNPITEKLDITLSPEEDAVIQLPEDHILPVAGIAVAYGRHVRVIGGHLMGLRPADESLRAVLRFAGQSGSVFVEGLVIDANQQYGLDGLLVGGVAHKPDVVADVSVQNCLIKGVTSTRKGLHADGFQFYGPVGWMRMDRVSVSAQYQGLFLDPQNDIGGLDLRHVDLRYEDPAQGTGYLFFLRVEKDRPRHPPVSLQEVYVGEAQNRAPWEEFVLYPPASRANGAVVKGQSASFPAFPEVKGVVMRGAPPPGPFVREGAAGLHYVSPGYL